MPAIRNPEYYFSRLSGGGSFRVAGTVKVEAGVVDAPVRRHVRLHDQAGGAMLRGMWSDAATGAYSFDSVPAGTYFVTAFDHTGAYGGVIETNITPEPMP